MAAPEQSEGTLVERKYATSEVRRVERPGGVVYVKRYGTGVDGALSTEHVRAKLRREQHLLALMHASPPRNPRLGLVEVVDVDIDGLVVTTKEVPGVSLQDLLLNRRADRDILTALFLAGRWQRWFQTLPVSEEDIQSRSGNDPLDLVAYCDIRLRKLREFGYVWPNEEEHREVLDALQQLVDASDPEHLRPVWAHSDYAPGNILWDGNRLTPIDFTMAHISTALTDVTHLIHRMEMFAVYFPWRRWPVDRWREAVLRGYGQADLAEQPAYRASMVRHHVCRLLTYVRRGAENLKQSLHNSYVRARVRHRLLCLLGLR